MGRRNSLFPDTGWTDPVPPTSSFKVFWTQTLVLALLLNTADSSNLPLLSGILRTFQVHACDGDDLVIECYPNTIININLAQYGRQVPSYELCPPLTPNMVASADDHYYAENDTTNCVANETLRYTILQTVEAACREQRTCKVRTSPDSFGGDPCPGVRKYAEVAYKCRPNSFFNKIVCEGERLILRCGKAQRIVIYSAAFGGTHYDVINCPQPAGVKGHDCQVSYATETVMSSCHGKRKCSVGADLGTFGSPGCPKGVRLHLKVVYTCVPKEILKELDLAKGGTSQSGDFSDETKEQLESDGDYPALVDENQPASTYTNYGPPQAQPAPPPVVPAGFLPPKKETDLEYAGGDINKAGTVHSKIGHYHPQTTKAPGESKDASGSVGGTASSAGGINVVVGSSGRARLKPTIKTDMQSDENLDGELSDNNCTEEQRVIGFLTEWVNAFNYVKSNKEKFILYLTVSLSAGLVAFLLVLAARLYIQKRRDRRPASKIRISEPLTSPYGGEDMAELDAAFDATDRLTTTALTGTSPLAASGCEPEVVRYTNSRNTMRRQDSDTHPRAPVARNMNNYYYS